MVRQDLSICCRLTHSLFLLLIEPQIITNCLSCFVIRLSCIAHENLEPCVGECVVGFCAALLGDKVSSGIWFPEEAIVSQEDTAAVLGLAGVGAHTLEVQSDDGLSVGDVWGGEQ